MPDHTDDWEIAGGLRGAPVELTRCKTCDIEVPATAEVVIEFEVDMDNPAMEGRSANTRATTRRLAHRWRGHRHHPPEKPIFQGLLTGKPVTENHILKQIPFEASFLDAEGASSDRQRRVGAGVGGRSFFVVISMTPRFEGELRQLILNAMSSNIRPKWT